MKRKDLIRHLEKRGCEFLRDGANHTVYVNRKKKKVSTVPRHREIDDNLAKKSVKTWEFLRPNTILQGMSNNRLLCC